MWGLCLAVDTCLCWALGALCRGPQSPLPNHPEEPSQGPAVAWHGRLITLSHRPRAWLLCSGQQSQPGAWESVSGCPLLWGKWSWVGSVCTRVSCPAPLMLQVVPHKGTKGTSPEPGEALLISSDHHSRRSGAESSAGSRSGWCGRTMDLCPPQRCV